MIIRRNLTHDLKEANLIRTSGFKKANLNEAPDLIEANTYNIDNTCNILEGDPDVECLTRLALKNKGDETAFDDIKDKAILPKIAEKLTTCFNKYLKPTSSKGEELEYREGRASVLSLMEALAVRAGRLNDKGLKKAITKELTGFILREPFRLVKDLACDSALGRAEQKDMPFVKDLKESIYPDKVSIGKEIKMMLYVDNAGAKLSDQIKFLKGLGFQHNEAPNGDHLFYLPVTWRKKAVFATLRNSNNIFEHAGDKEINVIFSSGHAGYGRRVANAIDPANNKPADGQIAIIGECTGTHNIGPIKNVYPGLQIITTTETSSDFVHRVFFETFLDCIRRGKDWPVIFKKCSNKLKKDTLYDPAHFTYPHIRRMNVIHCNRDKDPVIDVDDHLFNVTYPKQPDSILGFNSVVQSLPDHKLDSENLNKSLNNLKLIMTYNSFIGNNHSIPWGSDVIQNKGLFTPSERDEKAFRFSIDKNNKKLDVELSRNFVHTHEKLLCRMLAYEAGLFLGKEAGLKKDETVALALSMLERAIHQEGSPETLDFGFLFAFPAMEELLLLERYGIKGITLKDVQASLNIQGEEAGTEAHFRALVESLKNIPDIGEIADVGPKRVGKEIKLTEKIGPPLTPDIGFEFLDMVLNKLDIKGKTAAMVLLESKNLNESKNVIIGVGDGWDKPYNIHLNLCLGLDSDNIVHTAALPNLNRDRLRETIADNFLTYFAKGTSISLKTLNEIYEKSKGEGKESIPALLDTLKWARISLPPGTHLKNMGFFTRGLITSCSSTQEESKAIDKFLTRLYPVGSTIFGGLFFDSKKASEIELDFIKWIDKVADACHLDKVKLHDTYISGLVNSNSRSSALIETIKLLPDSLPKDIPPVPASIFTCWSVREDDDAVTLLEVLQKQAGLTSNALMESIMENEWLFDFYEEHVKNACRKAAKTVFENNASPFDFIKTVAKAAYDAKSPIPLFIDLNLFERYKLINKSEKEDICKYLVQELKYPTCGNPIFDFRGKLNSINV